ncbi:unnamed protein product, partial [Didymodactylos carnosus]
MEPWGTPDGTEDKK